MSTTGLNFMGQFWGCLGIPNHTRAFANSLMDNFVDVNLIPIMPNQNNDRYGIEGRLATKLDNPNLNKDYPTLLFWYPNTYKQLLDPVPSGQPKIGYYIFEYTKMPPMYVEEINRLDAICTASKWGAEVLKNNGVTVPIHVVPGGVDHSVFNSSKRNLDPKKFRFLHMGKAEKRKGTILIIKAFNKAFKGDRKIRLSLYIDNPHMREFDADVFLHNIADEADLEHPVTNIDVQHFQEDLVSIYNAHHASVFASRAEGIGLSIVESMACGMPVITTYNSGITEYATDDNAILIKDLKEEPVHDTHFFPNQGEYGTWNSASVDQIAEKMRWVYDNYDQAKLIGERAEKDMKDNYQWNQAAQKFWGVVNEKVLS